MPSCHNTKLRNVRLRNESSLSVGGGGRAVERRTVNRGDSVSIPSAAVSKLRQFHSPHICLCLSEEILNAGGTLLSGVIWQEIKLSQTLILEKNNCCVSAGLGCLEETT